MLMLMTGNKVHNNLLPLLLGCEDEASDATNQIIHVQNGTVESWQPAVIESYLSEELWSLDQ